MNACELEIELFCRGLRVPDHVRLDGARGISRTRAGLGSGLELVIASDSRVKREVWVNAPVIEAFVARSPFELTGDPEFGYAIGDVRTAELYPVRLPAEPAWYQAKTSGGETMSRVGVLQGTYLGIYLNMVCAFWSYSPTLECRFCTTGKNVGVNETQDKSVADVVETCRRARDESGVTFVHLNGGFQGSRGLKAVEPYVRAIKNEVGLLVGVQLTPERDFSQYDALIDLGVDHFSFCVEFFDPEWFEKMCPGKARMLGQELFFRALEHCARQMPRGAVSGELIAGVEPIEATFNAIDYIAAHRAFPTVCVFRPTIGSAMEHWPPPSPAEMRRVMAHVYDACRRHWLPIGAAPNIEVSLVVTPDDAAMLAPRTINVLAYEVFRKAVRAAARPMFRRRMRPRHAQAV